MTGKEHDTSDLYFSFILLIDWLTFGCAGSLLLDRLFSLVVESGGYMGSAVAAHGLTCSVAHGIFLGQGSNLCLLHGQADSLSLSHQGSPQICTLKRFTWWSGGWESALQCRGHRFNPGWGTKISHATEQLSLWAAARGLSCHHYWAYVL